MDIKTELANNPDLIPQAIEALKEQKYIIRDENQETEFQNNLIKTKLPEHLGPEIKKIHDLYDKDVFETSGLERQQDEKSYDYTKRAISHYKTEVEKLKNDYEALKGSTKGGEELKAQYEAKLSELQKQSAKAIEEWQGKYNELESKTSTLSKQREIDGIMNPLRAKFKEDPGPFFKSHEEKVIGFVNQNSKKAETGEFVMLNPDGSVMTDNTTFKPVLVNDYLQEQFKDAIKSKNGKGGAGSGKEGPKFNPKTQKADDYPIGQYENLDELVEGLMKDGIASGTEMFSTIYKKANAAGLKRKI